MGMVFNSAETVRLCGRLNRRFSEKRLNKIRSDPSRLLKFINANTNHRTLARIAYKSGTYPGNSPTDNVAKRWFYFLQNLPAGVSLAIKEALETALTATDPTGSTYVYESLVFVAYEGTTTSFTPIDLPVRDAYGIPTGTSSMLFSLQTAGAGNSTYTPPPDQGEDDTTEPDDGPPDTDSGSGSVKLPKRLGAKKKVAKKKIKKKAAKRKKQ
jgi:hypothetical protein